MHIWQRLQRRMVCLGPRLQPQMAEMDQREVSKYVQSTMIEIVVVLYFSSLAELHWYSINISYVQDATAQSNMVLPGIGAKSASNISTTPKLPDISPTEDENNKTGLDKEETQDEITKIQSIQPEDDFDLLTKRFAALKRG